MPKELIIGSSEEFWDYNAEKFVYPKKTTIVIEHSLLAISKWESEFHRSFFKENEAPKTYEDMVAYIRCMIISSEYDEDALNQINWKEIDEAIKYMNDPMTATKIRSRKKPRKINGEYLTNEIVYYWMAYYGIPYECQYWHFNRLMTLIEVANDKNSTHEKMSPRATARDYAELNALRLKTFGTKG